MILSQIYADCTGEALDWAQGDFSGMGGAEKKLLKETAKEEGIPEGLLIELFELEQRFEGMSKRSGISMELKKQ